MSRSDRTLGDDSNVPARLRAGGGERQENAGNTVAESRRVQLELTHE